MSKCVTCKKPVGDADKAIGCEICRNWWHTSCLKISNEKYELLKDDSVHWYCKNCNVAAAKIHQKFVLLQQRQDSLEERVNHMEKEMVTRKSVKQITQTEIEKTEASIKTELSKITDKLEEQIATEVSSQLQAAKADTGNDQPPVQENTKKTIREIVSEFDDINKRRNNIIIHRLTESSNEEEVQKLNEILNKIDPSLSLASSISRRRLGKPSEDKTRPLLITFAKEETVAKIFSNVKKLKNSGYNISISSDLPQETRNYRQSLIQQAKSSKGDQADNFLYQVTGKPGKETVKAIPKRVP